MYGMIDSLSTKSNKNVVATVVKAITLFMVATAFTACGVDRQARALKALEKCRYEIVSADSVYLAGTDVSKLVASRRIDVSQLPGVALGFFNGDIPLSGILTIAITNPTPDVAGIQQFNYKIAIEGTEVVEGVSERSIEIAPGETVTVPLRLQTNVHPFLSDRQTLNKVMAFLQRMQHGTNEKINLTFSIKPTIALGSKRLNYPGYIHIDKTVDASRLNVFRTAPRSTADSALK